MQYSTDPLNSETAPVKLPEMRQQATSACDVSYFIIEKSLLPSGSASGTAETRPSSSDYQSFLASKRAIAPTSGIEVAIEDIHPMLFEFQKTLVQWALRKGRCALFADTGLGKALPIDTPVLTPHGYRTMGELKVGDEVIGSNGHPTKVLGVYPQGIRPSYAVHFSDGSSTQCDIEHLWPVQTKVQKYRKQGYKALTLKEILETGLKSQEGWRFFIPMVRPVEFEESPLPMDPYTLGVILGDGCISQGAPHISSPDKPVLDRINDALPCGMQVVKHKSQYEWYIRNTNPNGHLVNSVSQALRDLGLMGSKAEHKFIPDAYKFASRQSREALLQGLLDTDGHARPSDNNVEYCTSSRQLAEDVVFLVQSLGGRATIRSRIPQYVHNGEKRTGLVNYRMSVALPDDIQPFYLDRKASAYHPRTKYQPTRAIVSAEPDGETEMVCIAVDAPDHCYVIEHCIVTHNTMMQVEWARLTRQRALIVAPLSVARQTVGEAAKIGVEVHYTRSGDDLRQINITNYEMLSHFNPDDFGAVVLDECFAPDTPIDTLNGLVPIKDIRRGDFIHNAAGIDRVSDVHRREVQYAVRITVNGKSIISSPNHPYFTQRGWIGAQDLQPGDSLIHTHEAVRMVRGGVSPQEQKRGAREAVLQSILLSEMADAPAGTYRKSAHPGSREETRREEKSLVCIGQPQSRSGEGTHTSAQPNVTSRDARESLPPIERNPAQTFRAWGQRDWFNRATTDTTRCTGRRLDSGIRFVTGDTDSRLSHELQARLSEYRAKNRYRGGWTLASLPQGAGSEERCETGFSRVDRLEVLEPGHPDLEKLRDADGCIYLYDIGATRHPSFSINGMLVHNSSILKAVDGETRNTLTEMFASTPYRLCCTATPAPNDLIEIGNHAEFLGVMPLTHMQSTFFVHDSGHGSGTGWRLKGHAYDAFYKWMASWSMSVKKPSDLGFSDQGYNLPALSVERVLVGTDYAPSDQLFFTGLKGITDRSRARKGTIEERVQCAVDLVAHDADQWILWCGMNDESAALARAVPDSIEITGSDSPDAKIAAIEAFQSGKYRVLITKPKIAGFGINLQNCHKMAFIGIGDSFESYYQCLRRCYRFGQAYPVNAYVVISEIEQEIYANVQRKEQEAASMSEQLIARVKTFEREEIEQATRREEYVTSTVRNGHYTLMQGDSCERMAEIPDNSVGLTITSIPFQDLFCYSPTERDLGNSKTTSEFYQHLGYIIAHTLRVTQPGRDCCVHVQQVAASLVKDGFIGLKDFRGEVTRAFVEQGWIYHGEITVDKNPQAQAVRTKAKGLLFVQLRKDASWMRPGLADYVLIFRKPGENATPVHPDLSNDEWIKFAHPVWYDIRESDTLNAAEARESDDEKHVCPLQLSLIERCIRLWSNPGELILDPFTGIGSTGYEAIRHGRKFVGCELKPSYYQAARKNLDRMIRQKSQATLFDFAESEVTA